METTVSHILAKNSQGMTDRNMGKLLTASKSSSATAHGISNSKRMKRRLLKKGLYICMLCLLMSTMLTFTIHAEVMLDAPSTVRVWRASNTSLCLKWSKVKEGDGYIVYKYDKKAKKYKKCKVLKGKKTQSLLIRQIFIKRLDTK